MQVTTVRSVGAITLRQPTERTAMPRLAAIDPARADSRTKPLLDAVHRKLGVTPNMMRTMAQSPAVLKGYLDLAGALSAASVDARTQELIAIAVAETNGCEYCLSAHTAIGGLFKIPAADLDAARDIRNANPRTAAMLRFARTVVATRGKVSDADVAAVRNAGATDAEIAEVIAVAALNVFTNLFNNVAGTDVDFPRVSPRLAVAA
jgi:uncharacterized peroxidase-related enzyme